MKLDAGEQVVRMDKSARSVKGKLSVSPGNLALTNQRLVFERRSSFALAFGLIGALVFSALPGKLTMNLPLGQVASFSRGSYGMNKNVLLIMGRDGVEHKFIVNFDAWASMLAQAGIAQS